MSEGLKFPNLTGEQLGRIMQSPEIAIPAAIGVVIGACAFAAAAAIVPHAKRAATYLIGGTADVMSEVSTEVADWFNTLNLAAKQPAVEVIAAGE